METQTRLICHYKFISTENITILSVSSDDLNIYIYIYIYIDVCVCVGIFRRSRCMRDQQFN